MDNSVVSWPPCIVWVEVKTPAGLPARPPLNHSELVPSKKYFKGAAMLPKRVGLPTIKPAHSVKSACAAYGGPRSGISATALLALSGDGRNSAQACLGATQFDAAAHLAGQLRRRPFARIIQDENFHHVEAPWAGRVCNSQAALLRRAQDCALFTISRVGRGSLATLTPLHVLVSVRRPSIISLI